MALRVTFDTNTLDLACRLDRFPKDPRRSLMQKVHNALEDGRIEGFYSVTVLTIEGIMREDRAGVFARSRIVAQSETTGMIRNVDLPNESREKVGSGDLETIVMELRVEQPDRKPLHPEVDARAKAAKAVGFRLLKAVPRIGAFHIADPTGEYYLNPGEGADLSA